MNIALFFQKLLAFILETDTPKMEEEMITLQNIMPVELAIKRELEYRKKMEISRNQHQNNLKPLLLTQGPHIQSWKEDTKLAASGSQKSRVFHFSSNCQPLRVKRLFSCKVPGLESQMVVDRKRKVPPSNARFVCVVCRMAFATVFHLKMHGETFAHRTKVLMAKNGGKNVSNPFLCELCDIMCSGARVMEFHVAGLKHADFLQDFERAKRARIYGYLG
ncbi:hypothetical protein L2E82_13665 [Cichorium intybus]|uniref:Uncharacterized protein n=1 Tax=Cichorium intybus TaxID=13427 RepID=A0ACB9EY88_CICIN|nr:hypothetical protein L2E82_13665 [Cichorium intybus]